ncbi:MAG: LytTR family DNA-binding domain-containing protein [Chthoniobacter sp.]
MKSIRVLLVDDERIGRTRLRRLLESEPDIEVVAECADGQAALEALREQDADVLFLDINMPGMDGFDLLEQLGPDAQPLVVFVTAYDEHAVRAFDACALDYLLKPVSPARLAKTLGRVRVQLSVHLPAEVSAGAGSPEGSTVPGVMRFVVRSGGRISFVAVDEIDWVEAAGNYAIFHVGKQNHMVRETMSGLESQLPADRFMRVSRSAIIHLSRIKELTSSSAGNDVAILVDEQRIPITRSVREIADRLGAS